MVDSLINPIMEFTEVRESKIHGFGLFAKTVIPKNTVWWRAENKDVMILDKAQFTTLANSHRESSSDSPNPINSFITCFLNYAAYDSDSDAFVLSLDNARLVNHSETPNSSPMWFFISFG